MVKIKYTPSTIYIMNPDLVDWDELKDSPKSVSYEMYKDLVSVNSGAILLQDQIGTKISHDIVCNKIMFVYPVADRDDVCTMLYNILRDASVNGIIFNSSKFRFNVEYIKGSDINLTEEYLLGLEVRFIK